VGSLIEDVLRDYGLEYDSFRRRTNEGKILLILDGFDEMSIDMSKRIAFKNLIELNKLFAGKGKFIITSRTHYFKSKLEEEELLVVKDDGFTGIRWKDEKDRKRIKIIYLEEFSLEDIQKYLDRIFKETGRNYHEQIEKVYNLRDLAKKPILLNLIVQIPPESFKGKITPGKLYDIVTIRWIEREMKEKGRWIDVEINDVIFFMQELAFWMFQTGRFEIHFENLPKKIKAHFRERILSQIDLDDWDGKVRTSSFLNRDAKGNYSFMYRSFMEFFVAKKLANELKENKAPHVKISKEIRDFITDLLADYRPPKFEGKLPEGVVYVPAGQFIYGKENEIINLKKGFFIDVTPVTNAQYKKFKPSHTYERGKENHPVVHVTWADAIRYAKWAGKRLPTEEEWEKAARGIDGREYPWGNKFDSKKCNTFESGIYGTTPVDRYPEGKSPYGCYDMAGNVWEWTDSSWYVKYKLNRVLRGGSWNSTRHHACCPNHSFPLTDSYWLYTGFRCAKDIP